MSQVMDKTTQEYIRILGQQYILEDEAEPVFRIAEELISRELETKSPSWKWITMGIFQLGIIWGKRIERARRRGISQKERMQTWT